MTTRTIFPEWTLAANPGHPIFICTYFFLAKAQHGRLGFAIFVSSKPFTIIYADSESRIALSWRLGCVIDTPLNINLHLRE